RQTADTHVAEMRESARCGIENLHTIAGGDIELATARIDRHGLRDRIAELAKNGAGNGIEEKERPAAGGSPEPVGSVERHAVNRFGQSGQGNAGDAPLAREVEKLIAPWSAAGQNR